MPAIGEPYLSLDMVHMRPEHLFQKSVILAGASKASDEYRRYDLSMFVIMSKSCLFSISSLHSKKTAECCGLHMVVDRSCHELDADIAGKCKLTNRIAFACAFGQRVMHQHRMCQE